MIMTIMFMIKDSCDDNDEPMLIICISFIGICIIYNNICIMFINICIIFINICIISDDIYGRGNFIF